MLNSWTIDCSLDGMLCASVMGLFVPIRGGSAALLCLPFILFVAGRLCSREPYESVWPGQALVHSAPVGM